MNFGPVLLDDLARVFAEAALRELETKIPADVAGTRNNVALKSKESRNNETIHPKTDTPQAADS